MHKIAHFLMPILFVSSARGILSGIPRCKRGRWLAMGSSNNPDHDKEIIFIRHGVTEMNEWLARPGKSWGSKGFEDAGFYDTVLTSRGILQAERLGQAFLDVDPMVELLVSSPLTRALQTADKAFDAAQVSPGKRMVVTPLCAERLYLSSDVGRSPAVLQLEFPAFNFSDSMASSKGEPWWYTPSLEEKDYEEWRPRGAYCVPGEPHKEFEKRLLQLKLWLASQPERRIAVVSHWGVIDALTGMSLNNCESVCVSLKTILERPVTIRH
mmetsp:Transcript_35641/g.72639  ORF Transcript_35641/g.72639 Transcript_35641/m.72639 type:complete len:268 (-) Transcript_35641:91-894(-)